jgi:hypothetical protein
MRKSDIEKMIAASGFTLRGMATTANPKVGKANLELGIKAACLHLNPSYADWVCVSKGLCGDLCLDGAGTPAHADAKLKARTARTALLKSDLRLFMIGLVFAIAKHQSDAIKALLECVFRLNATSDIPFEAKKYHFVLTYEECDLLNRLYNVGAIAGAQYSIFSLFPNVQFLDYTKVFARLTRKLPDNYYLLFSLDGPNNVTAAIKAHRLGFNISVPFLCNLPDTFTLSNGIESITLPVFNGDDSDIRYLDPVGHVVGLKFKILTNGKSNKNNGFLMETNSVTQAPFFKTAA